MSRAILTIAGIAAAAVWLPWPLGETGDDVSRQAKFASRGDPTASHASLASRPLLDPTRGTKARSAARAQTDAPVEFDQRYALKGIAKHETADIIVVEDRVAKKSIRLQRGQTIGDWFLLDVVGQDARLQNAGGETRVLKMPPISVAATAPGMPSPPAGNGPAPSASSELPFPPPGAPAGMPFPPPGMPFPPADGGMRAK